MARAFSRFRECQEQPIYLAHAAVVVLHGLNLGLLILGWVGRCRLDSGSWLFGASGSG